jgi:hypothetical protein
MVGSVFFDFFSKARLLHANQFHLAFGCDPLHNCCSKFTLDNESNSMKRKLPVILLLGITSLSAFDEEPANHEQAAFDYFVSDILVSDFKDITSFQFKGRTEDSFSSLGKYKICLTPEKKLGSLIENLTKGARRSAKEIRYKNSNGLTILDFESKTRSSRLLIYPSLHVADNYYVLLLFQQPEEQPAKYVFEVTPEGKISRSCRMD